MYSLTQRDVKDKNIFSADELNSSIFLFTAKCVCDLQFPDEWAKSGSCRADPPAGQHGAGLDKSQGISDGVSIETFTLGGGGLFTTTVQSDHCCAAWAPEGLEALPALEEQSLCLYTHDPDKNVDLYSAALQQRLTATCPQKAGVDQGHFIIGALLKISPTHILTCPNGSRV